MSGATAQSAAGPGSARAGSRALSLFARTLSADVLRAHEEGALSPGALRERLGWAAPASLRAATADLRRHGALARGAEHGTATELTAAGRGLLTVADGVERWLSSSAFGALRLSDAAARGVVRALVAGWDSTMVHALAERPRTLAELSAEIQPYSYPALKRRLGQLRTAGLAARVGGDERSPAFGATAALHRAAESLALAGRWELDFPDGSGRPTSRDLEAILMLGLPLAAAPPGVSDSCVLAVSRAIESPSEGQAESAAIRLVLDLGGANADEAGGRMAPEARLAGSPEVWLTALTRGPQTGLRLRGVSAGLAQGILGGLCRGMRGEAQPG